MVEHRHNTADILQKEHSRVCVLLRNRDGGGGGGGGGGERERERERERGGVGGFS